VTVVGGVWTANTREGLVAEFHRSGSWNDESITARFARACYESCPDSRLIVISGQRPSTMSFREIRTASLTLASGLRQIGVGPGTSIAMQLPNWMEA
jgi:non-ribosomal peptide synthetase component E (peptide arylation enzyme)